MVRPTFFDMINVGGHPCNGIGTEEATQEEAYDIDGQTLFDIPSANATAFYADTQEDEETEDEEDTEAGREAKVEGIAVGGTAATTTATKKRISKRTVCYTPKEDVCLCWNLRCRKKGKASWRRVTIDFHERRLLNSLKIHSDYIQLSIQRRWSLI
jgi:hypothetical protein